MQRKEYFYHVKHTLTFLLLFLVFLNTENAHSQEEEFQSKQIQLFGKENPSEKEMKKVFRKMRRKVPNRSMRKDLKEYQAYYLELIAEDKAQADSIEQQKIKVAKLTAELDEAEKRDEVRIAALRAENDSLEEVMRMYIKQIDSLNTINLRLETTRQNAGAYYFNLADFVEPKVYFYQNQADPSLSHYWKISSVLSDSLLITEAYGADFKQFEVFTEKYDSIGSKVIEYISLSETDSTFSDIIESEVYRWNSEEAYSYSIKYIRSGIYLGYRKDRKFQALDSMEILGDRIEVARFKDEYTYFHGFVTHEHQQSFYSKEYGLVRFLRFDEVNKTNETYILKAIYTEEEWQELQR